MDTPPPQAPAAQDSADIQQNKDIAALSYVWILSVVAYFTRRHSPFVQFHARQGMALFLVSVLVWPMPFIGKILELGVLALAAMGFVFAAQGKRIDVPLIGPLSRGDFKGVRTSWKQFVEAAGDLARSMQSSNAAKTPATDTVVPPTPAPQPPAAAPAPAPAPTPAPAAPAVVAPAEPQSSVSVMQPPAPAPMPPQPPAAPPPPPTV